MQEIWIIDEIKTVREKKDGRRINMLETFILTLSILNTRQVNFGRLNSYMADGKAISIKKFVFFL